MQLLKVEHILGVIYFAIFSLAGAETSINLTDDALQAEWQPTANEELTVNVDEGYSIAVNITNCNLNGDKGDFVRITNVVEDFYSDDYTDIMFSYVCVTNMSYFYESNQVKAQYKAADKTSMFKAIFSRIGDKIVSTTTDIPTSTIYLPTPSDRDQAEITVYIYGAKPEVFSNTSKALQSLKEALANMAIDYLSVNNFPLNGSISTNNVIIQNLEQCSLTWEDYDDCIMLSFSIPINLLNEPENTRWSGYQLDENHLKILWETYASIYIPRTGLQLYPIPNIDGIFKLRLIVAVTVTVALAIAMLTTMKVVVKKINRKRKNQQTEQMSIVDNSSTRPSNISLTPHYLQETPPWENEAPVFPTQGYRNLGYEPDNQFEDFEHRLSPDLRLSPGPDQDKFDLVDLGSLNEEEQA